MELFIKQLHSTPFLITVDTNSTISDVKAEISLILRTDSNLLHLIFKGRLLNDYDTLSGLGLRSRDSLYLHSKSDKQDKKSVFYEYNNFSNPHKKAKSRKMLKITTSEIVENPFFQKMMNSIRDKLAPHYRHAFSDEESMVEKYLACIDPELRYEWMKAADRTANITESRVSGFKYMVQHYKAVNSLFDDYTQSLSNDNANHNSLGIDLILANNGPIKGSLSKSGKTIIPDKPAIPSDRPLRLDFYNDEILAFAECVSIENSSISPDLSLKIFKLLSNIQKYNEKDKNDDDSHCSNNLPDDSNNQENRSSSFKSFYKHMMNENANQKKKESNNKFDSNENLFGLPKIKKSKKTKKNKASLYSGFDAPNLDKDTNFDYEYDSLKIDDFHLMDDNFEYDSLKINDFNLMDDNDYVNKNSDIFSDIEDLDKIEPSIQVPKDDNKSFEDLNLQLKHEDE